MITPTKGISPQRALLSVGAASGQCPGEPANRESNVASTQGMAS